LGLQELVALHLLSSYYFVFNALANVGLPSANPTTDSSSTAANTHLAPFSLCLKVLTSLPAYTGEIYRGRFILLIGRCFSFAGVNMKFESKNFEVGAELTWTALTMCTSSWFELVVCDSLNDKLFFDPFFLFNLFFFFYVSLIVSFADV
jgi:hypothetical protein